MNRCDIYDKNRYPTRESCSMMDFMKDIDTDLSRYHAIELLLLVSSQLTSYDPILSYPISYNDSSSSECNMTVRAVEISCYRVSGLTALQASKLDRGQCASELKKE